ncbi:hypothetical protein ACHQM5_021660 [Ranunculus cassubicifolius]
MEMQAQVNAFLSKQGAFQEPNMRCSTSRNASQEVHTRFPSTPSPYFPPSQQMCELKSLGGKVVAWGRILTDRDGVSEDAYNIVIDGIFDLDAELFGANGQTFGDINIGETIQWLKVLTRID